MLCCDGLQDWKKSPGPFIMGICPVVFVPVAFICPVVLAPVAFIIVLVASLRAVDDFPIDVDRMASSICCIFEFASVEQPCEIDDWIGTYGFGPLRCAWKRKERLAAMLMFCAKQPDEI